MRYRVVRVLIELRYRSTRLIELLRCSTRLIEFAERCDAPSHPPILSRAPFCPFEIPTLSEQTPG